MSGVFGGSAPVISTSWVFHYFLHGPPDPARLAVDGLRARPVPRGGEEDLAQRSIYSELFEPALGMPYPRPGVFLTPVDFRALPGTLLADRPRVAVDVAELDPASCVLTWQLRDRRVRLTPSEATLRIAASVWTTPRLREWFGRDRTRLFWHVPQIGCFGKAPIEVGEVDDPSRPG